ncbi:DUF4349 domain-containing protein [Erythrobacter sp. HKB08]|uniref:DUF4349 domain-containing protein n=1 Tax=Erythrobacter sp. HKB08 TaxID=2502843 RepID=UPI00100898CA|nr:DUF4349 domain-containing protein [Erythrobacter sp. HKB08]
MRKSFVFPALAALALTACGESEQVNEAEAVVERIEPEAVGDAPVNEFGFWEAQSSGPLNMFDSGPSAGPGSAVRQVARRTETAETSQAQVQPAQSSIAYSYSFGFQIDQEDIPELQKAHVALCEGLGPKCRILRMSQAGSDGYDGYGQLQLQVEANQARAFGDALRAPAEELGGEQVSFVVDGEDLSETIIDTEARLASRLVLRDKLTAILQGNRGSVDELVKAEKAVAEINQEIDSTRSKLQELRNRIRFSMVSIEYNTAWTNRQVGFVEPVRDAIASIGSTLGVTVSALIYIATALVPITLFLLAIRWILHRFGLRIRFWRKRERETAES